jgi:uncharacterized membrane-anchored protein
MQEGLQLPELLAKVKALREAGLRAEHVAFSFMKRRVQPLMCHTRFSVENRMHLICVPGSQFSHI